MPTLDLVREAELAVPPLRRPLRPRLADIVTSSVPARVDAGEVCLIEIAAGAGGFSPIELQLLASANVIVFEPAFTARIAAVLPLGTYAEPAAPTAASTGPILFERGVRFARDGWSVVQLVEAPASDRARQERIHRLQGELDIAGAGADLRVRIIVGGAAAGHCETVETAPRDLDAVFDSFGLDGGLAVIFGPFAGGPSPQAYAFAANGLAG